MERYDNCDTCRNNKPFEMPEEIVNALRERIIKRERLPHKPSAMVIINKPASNWLEHVNLW